MTAEGTPISSPSDLERALDALDRQPIVIQARDWPAGTPELSNAGLYSWWVDRRGAEILAEGLALPLCTGRIYAGQTGATSWPSGKPSSSSLERRVGGLHLRGRIRGSTFRLTLAAILRGPLALKGVGPKKLEKESEDRVSEWMRQHLSVAVFPFEDRDCLDDLESRVLACFDPPLNLAKMDSTQVRQKLSELRRHLARPDED